MGYAIIKSVEDKGNYFLVTANHIIKDVYAGIGYEDFIATLPLHGFKIGFDNLFTHTYESGDATQEHHIYAYNLKNNVVIVAQTFTYEGTTQILFNSIKVYCPQVKINNPYTSSMNRYMTVFDLTYKSNGKRKDLLKWINNIMKDVKTPYWPKNSYPYLWTYADCQDDHVNCSGEYLLNY